MRILNIKTNQIFKSDKEKIILISLNQLCKYRINTLPDNITFKFDTEKDHTAIFKWNM